MKNCLFVFFSIRILLIHGMWIGPWLFDVYVIVILPTSIQFFYSESIQRQYKLDSKEKEITDLLGYIINPNKIVLLLFIIQTINHGWYLKSNLTSLYVVFTGTCKEQSKLIKFLIIISSQIIHKIIYIRTLFRRVKIHFNKYI